MGKFFGNACDDEGDLFPVLVSVTDFDTGVLVPIYEDDEVTRKANPFASDGRGQLSFCCGSTTSTLPSGKGLTGASAASAVVIL